MQIILLDATYLLALFVQDVDASLFLSPRIGHELLLLILPFAHSDVLPLRVGHLFAIPLFFYPLKPCL